MARLTRLVAALGRAEMWFCCLLLGLVVAVIFYQVVARYLFNAPLAWMEELGTYAFIWLVLVGAAAAAKHHRHVLIDLFPPSALARRLGRLMQGIALVAFAIVIWKAIPIVAVEMRTSSVSLPINGPRALFFSIPLIYGLSSISLTIICDLLAVRET